MKTTNRPHAPRSSASQKGAAFATGKSEWELSSQEEATAAAGHSTDRKENQELDFDEGKDPDDHKEEGSFCVLGWGRRY